MREQLRNRNVHNVMESFFTLKSLQAEVGDSTQISVSKLPRRSMGPMRLRKLLGLIGGGAAGSALKRLRADDSQQAKKRRLLH